MSREQTPLRLAPMRSPHHAFNHWGGLAMLVVGALALVLGMVLEVVRWAG